MLWCIKTCVFHLTCKHVVALPPARCGQHQIPYLEGLKCPSLKRSILETCVTYLSVLKEIYVLLSIKWQYFLAGGTLVISHLMLRTCFVVGCTCVKCCRQDRSVATTLKLQILCKLYLYISIVVFVDMGNGKKWCTTWSHDRGVEIVWHSKH